MVPPGSWCEDHYGEKITDCQCLALEAVFMQIFIPLRCHHALSDPNEPVLELN